jgi:prophage regulatory protein
MIAILRMPAVVTITGRSRMSIYRAVREGLFTQPVRIGMNAVGWPDYEVATLVAALVAGKTVDEVRAIVDDLHEKRKTALDEARRASN